MKYGLLLLMVFAAFSTAAQNCTEASLLEKPGVWKESSAGSSGITAADFAREKKNVAAIHAMIKSTYSPMGVHANFNGGYNRAEPYMPCNSYIYSIIPLNYYCDGNTIKTEHETSTYFSINSNIFDSEIYDTAQGDRLLMEGFNVMYNMPVEKDGYWYFKEADAPLGFGMTGKRIMWLITYDGKLPYTYVTKKEFLKKRRLALFAQMNIASEGFKDNLKNIEIEKKYKEQEYKNDPAKLNKYMKMDYLQIKARYEKLLAENEKSFRPAFDKIDAQLKMSAEELSQHAIVKDDPQDHLSYLFTTAEDPFRKILIKPNPDYFNKKLARSTAQFFWVYIRWNDQNPIATKFRNDIIKAVDFTTLKNMTGKDVVQPVKK